MSKPKKTLPRRTNESELEARIHEAVRRAFPWLEESELQHQTKFTLRVGRSPVVVGERAQSRTEARSDVIIYHKGKPLAVLELKRPGLKLTREDEEQGLSYAALLRPNPPLVVVTNGHDVRLLESHSGEEWTPGEPSEAALAELLESASRSAAADLRDAVNTLMGSGNGWVPAVRAATSTLIQDLTGAWDDSRLPFVADFLIPREATDQVLSSLRDGRKLVIVEGAPLAGKSSVLRDLAVRTSAGNKFAILLIEGGTGAGGGILRSLANLLNDALGWPVGPEDARTWLRRLSTRTGGSGGPALVLAIDGVDWEEHYVRAEIEELISGQYGSGLRLVVAVDEAMADRMVRSGRHLNPIGRKAKRVQVESLNDNEFESAAEVLWNLRFDMTVGASHSEDLRVPWVLRSLAARYAVQPEHGNERLAAALPPLLSLDLIDLARERFRDDHDLRIRLREVARAVLRDTEDRSRPVELLLESVATFVVRRSTLLDVARQEDVNFLVGEGVLKLTVGSGDEGIYVVRMPELAAASMAGLVAEDLAVRMGQDSAGETAAAWLVSHAQSLPLGDVIAARALLDVAARTGALPLNLIEHLVQRPPKTEPLKPGRYAAHVAQFGFVDVTVEPSGSLVDTATRGKRLHVPAEDLQRDAPEMYVDVYPWLILSHLAGVPMVAVRAGGVAPDPDDLRNRLDIALLLRVGQYPKVLRRPAKDPERSSVLTHSLPGGVAVVCHKQGVVEPIAFSILALLSSAGAGATEVVEEAVRTVSLPLLMRMYIALGVLAESADAGKAAWAVRMRDELVGPPLRGSLLLH